MATTLTIPTATAPAKMNQTHARPPRGLADSLVAMGCGEGAARVERSVCTWTTLAWPGWNPAGNSGREVRTPRIRHTGISDGPKYGVNTRIVPMAGSNAGVKRNRLPRGQKTVRPGLALASDTAAAYERAARASGDLSFSLYLEKLRRQFEDERGALPILGTAAVDHQEVADPAA